jgi:hypothetical protein
MQVIVACSKAAATRKKQISLCTLIFVKFLNGKPYTNFECGYCSSNL